MEDKQKIEVLKHALRDTQGTLQLMLQGLKISNDIHATEMAVIVSLRIDFIEKTLIEVI